MIVLSTVNDALELVTSSTANIDYYISFAQITSSSITIDSTQGTIASATTTTILSSPSGGEQYQVKLITITNRHATSSCNVTIQKDVSGTNYIIGGTYTLARGESLKVNAEGSFTVYDAQGREKKASTDVMGYTGIPFEFYKIGTSSEAIGNWYGFAKDSGFPGAWVPGTPGINGWWTNASQASNAANPAGATQAGCFVLNNPSSGSWYLLPPKVTVSTGHLMQLVDLLWYNTGIVVTTTTAQNITMPASSIPSRDLNGSTNGEGWNAAIYVTTATTNAGAITNTTISYTNESGTAGKTGTISSFPATAVAGTFVPIQLAAGDRGIRSIQSITLGTSYGGGAISLVLYRNLYSIANPVANVGGIGDTYVTNGTGVRIYNGTALWWVYRSSATTATTMAGTTMLIER
jgi:hypothetical protein